MKRAKLGARFPCYRLGVWLPLNIIGLPNLPVADGAEPECPLMLAEAPVKKIAPSHDGSGRGLGDQKAAVSRHGNRVRHNVGVESKALYLPMPSSIVPVL
jgi:hypothetical protein